MSQNQEEVFESLFKAALVTQSKVNEKATGPDWRSLGAEHEEIDYAMAAIDELAECWRSCHKFEWWRKTIPTAAEMQNAKVELVDTLHFIISEDLTKFKENIVLETALACLRVANERFAQYRKQGVTPDQLFRSCLKSMLQGLTYSNKENGACVVDWSSFFLLCYAIKSSPMEIMHMYQAKATLNIFRVENGYKEGKYKKIWTVGEKTDEDNVFIYEFVAFQLKNGLSVSPEKIRDWLTEYYALQISQPATAA